MTKKEDDVLGVFGRYLTVWVALCIVGGILIGKFMPVIPQTLDKFTYAQVSIPVAILIWIMIYPMMLKIDFTSIVKATKNPKGIIVTTGTNYLIQPFATYLIAALFFKIIFKNIIPEELASQYLAGAVILGAAPCTAMVFVWSHLVKGDSAYTLIQVTVNNLVLLIAYVPTVALLLGVSNIAVPYDTLLLSMVLFVAIPLLGAYLSRRYIVKSKGTDYFEDVFLKKFDNFTMVGLLLTLVIIFSFQGEVILNNPLHIVLIAIPLIIVAFIVFGISYSWGRAWKLPHDITGPSSLIATSNFFELAVAVAISLFGLDSGATLATVVGVLVEVPLMLFLVRIVNKTKYKTDK